MHMRPIRPEEPGAAKDSASMADALPPIYYPWLVVVGLILPYAVIIAGWWLVYIAAGVRKDDAWWDAAGNLIYGAEAAALAIGVWCCRPVFHRVRYPDQFALAGFLGFVYVVCLPVVNFCAYMRPTAPFP